MIDPRADRPVYRQLADLIRHQIDTGVLRPGARLPAISRLASEHGVGVDTAKNAIAVLRSEGLVITERPTGTRVRPAVERTEVRIPRYATWIVRMPSPAERDELGIDEGVPVVLVTHGSRTHLYAGGNRHFFTSL